MKSYQEFVQLMQESLERVELSEAAGDPSAFKERQKARQSAVISLAKSKAAKYRSHGVKGADRKARKKMDIKNRKTMKAAGQLGSAALSVVRAGVNKLKSMRKKDQEQP